MDSSSANDTPAPDELIAALDHGRQQFLALVAHVRPELHRYCTRMTGSVADGEDIVQDTLARACYELSQMKTLPPLRPWLFRIAHNRAIDHHRREAYRDAEPLDAAVDIAGSSALHPDERLARDQAVRAAVSSFLALPPAQRACVILKDVLDHSLEEIAEELSLSVLAVKAALHRGRTALRERVGTGPTPLPAGGFSPALARYAHLFNAHDWDGVRALLADDVRLDLVSRRKLQGRAEVGQYFSNYERVQGWHAAPAWLEGREVLAVYRGGDAPGYFVELSWNAGQQVAGIRDFRYADYVAQEAGLRSD